MEGKGGSDCVIPSGFIQGDAFSNRHSRVVAFKVLATAEGPQVAVVGVGIGVR